MTLQIIIERKSAMSIVAAILLVGAFVSVFAYNSSPANPSGFGHTANEVMVTGLFDDNGVALPDQPLLDYIDSRTSFSPALACESVAAFSSGKDEKTVGKIDLTGDRYNACTQGIGCNIYQEVYGSDTVTPVYTRTYSYLQIASGNSLENWETTRLGAKRTGSNGDGNRNHMIALTDYTGAGDTSYLALTDDRSNGQGTGIDPNVVDNTKTALIAQDSTASHGMKIFFCYPGAA